MDDLHCVLKSVEQNIIQLSNQRKLMKLLNLGELSVPRNGIKNTIKLKRAKCSSYENNKLLNLKELSVPRNGNNKLSDLRELSVSRNGNEKQ